MKLFSPDFGWLFSTWLSTAGPVTIGMTTLSFLKLSLLIFSWLLTRLSIILSLSCSSCLLRSFFLSFYILSAILLLFSTMLWMQVSATVWNFVIYSFSLRVFRTGPCAACVVRYCGWGFYSFNDSWLAVFFDYRYRTRILSGLASRLVIFFCKYMAFLCSFSM